MTQIQKAFTLALVLGLAACGGSSDDSSSSTTSSTTSDTTDEGGTTSGGTSGGSTASDTTAPTVSSVAISGGNATPSSTSLSTSTAVTNASTATSAFTMTFSEAMDDTTVTPTTVTLSCGGSAVAGTISKTNSTTFVFAPSATLAQQASCTFAIGTGAKDAASNALASIASYSLTSGCSTNDSFGSDVLSACWTANNSPTASVSNGTLTFTQTANTGQTIPSESKTFGSTDLTVTVKLPSFSGLTETDDSCAISLADETSSTEGAVVKVNLQSDGTGLNVTAATISGSSTSSTEISTSGTSSAALSGALYLRLTQSGTSVAASFRIGDSGDFTSVGSALSVSFGSTKKVGLAITSNGTGGEVSCSHDDFTVSGGSATGQD